MNDLWARMDPAYLIPLAFIVMGALTIMVITISICWFKARQHETDAALKRDMLNRGMSAADIKQVLEAGTPASDPAAIEMRRLELEAELKQQMIENGMPPEQMAKLLSSQ